MSRGVGRAQTLEAADDVDASSSVVARIGLAFVDVQAAQLSSEASALADWSGGTFLADSAVFARIGIAVAAVLAAFAAQTRRAFAAEVVVQVQTLAVVEARRGGARIRVSLAAGSNKSWPALTLIGHSASFGARSAVQTRLRAANTYKAAKNKRKRATKRKMFTLCTSQRVTHTHKANKCRLYRLPGRSSGVRQTNSTLVKRFSEATEAPLLFRLLLPLRTGEMFI